MPKFENNGTVKKINLAQIIETGNVREDYEGIEELSGTIKTNGQLQPILVKARGKNTDGVDEYELVAGHRRIRAFRYLCENGDDFNRIDAIVVTGDKLTLQLIENLQRSDLSAQERERGIYEMTKDGKVSQSDVAAMLGKNEQFVWRNLKARTIRELTAKAGLDTADISTNTLCEIATAADGDIPLLIERIKEEGGTLAVARRIGRGYRADKKIEPELTNGSKTEIEPQLDDGDDDDDYCIQDCERCKDMNCNSRQPTGLDIKSVPHISEIETSSDTDKKSKPKTEQYHVPRETRTLADFDPPHKSVDINDVLVIIKKYINKCNDNMREGSENTFYNERLEAKIAGAWDIIAFLHEGL